MDSMQEAAKARLKRAADVFREYNKELIHTLKEPVFDWVEREKEIYGEFRPQAPDGGEGESAPENEAAAEGEPAVEEAQVQ